MFRSATLRIPRSMPLYRSLVESNDGMLASSSRDRIAGSESRRKK